MDTFLKKTLLPSEKEVYSTYVLLDASGNNEVYEKALFNETRLEALLEEESFEAVSPYLMKIKEEDELSTWVFDNFKDANWISFVQSSKPYDTVLQTLKKFTKTYDEEIGQDVYIRYWDPRSVEIVLDMFGEEGREEWFETIDVMYARDTLYPKQVLKFTKVGKEILSTIKGAK